MELEIQKDLEPKYKCPSCQNKFELVQIKNIDNKKYCKTCSIEL